MKYTFAAAALCTLMSLASAHAEDAAKTGSPAAAPDKDYVMLRADGEDIRKSEIDEAWKSVFQGHEVPPFESMDEKVKAKFLREVVSEHVLYKEGQKEGIDSTPDVKILMERLKHQVVIQELLKDKTEPAVTDDKLKAAYEAHLNANKDSVGQDELNARHILVKTREEADAIEKKLKNGADFAKLAKEKSEDTASGATGGELGWFTPDKMLPEFSAAALKLNKGEISKPVKTDFGWHVIQLEDRRKAIPPTFDEMKETLKQEVATQAMSAYVKGLLANVKITELDAQGHEKSILAEDPAPAVRNGAGKNDKEDKDGAE